MGCFLASVGVNGFIIAPSSVLPLFIGRFAATTATVGSIVSVTFLGLILTQIPGGYLLDRFDNRRIVAPSVVLYLLIVVSIQWVQTFETLLALRMLGGVFVGLVFTGGANIIGEIVAGERQGLAVGIYLTSPPASFAIAHVTSPPVGSAYGPLRIFVVHGLISAIGLVLLVSAARDPIKSGGTPSLSEFTAALRNRAVLLVSISASAAYGLYLFLNSWLPTYGREFLSLSLAEAGLVTAVVPLVGIFARSGGGWLSGRLGGRRRPVLLLGLVAGVVLLMILPIADTVVVFVVLAAGAGFTVQLGTAVYYVFTRELASTGTEGTSLTILTTFSFVGSFLAPSTGGWLIATYSWTIALAAFVCLGLLGAVILIPVHEPE